MEFKVCSVCDEDKVVGDFYRDKHRPDGLACKCKKCYKEYADIYRLNNRGRIKARRRAFLIEQRMKAIEYKGGKCIRCGYNSYKYLRVFQFHHIDPKEKEVIFSFASNTFETYKDELDKCVLLCANCHMAVHEGATYDLCEITGGGTCGS